MTEEFIDLDKHPEMKVYYVSLLFKNGVDDEIERIIAYEKVDSMDSHLFSILQINWGFGFDEDMSDERGNKIYLIDISDNIYNFYLNSNIKPNEHTYKRGRYLNVYGSLCSAIREDKINKLVNDKE